MGQVGAMLSPAADNGLVDRILIEIDLDPNVEGRLRMIEHVIDWRRDGWHERIAGRLNEHDSVVQ
jgi:hypothetical protein